MFNETKVELCNVVMQETAFFCESQKLRCNSDYVSKKLLISRSLASQYLNDFYKAGRFIKISSHPVFFLDKETIENCFQITLEQKLFDEASDLFDVIGKKFLGKGSFLSAIGHETSLGQCVLQCQAAIKYPPNGLPMLLCGEHGVGKTFFTQIIFNYAQNEGILTRHAKLMTLKCGLNTDSDRSDAEKIFGNRRLLEDGRQEMVEGLIAQANNGILVIEDCDRLSVYCLSKLVEYWKYNVYCLENDKNSVLKSRTRLIFTTCGNPIDVQLSAFVHNIPVVCRMPPLSERPVEEKEALAIQFLKKESKTIGKNIFISYKTFDVLMGIHYKNNIEEMFSVLKTTCANAFLKTGSQPQMEILLSNLPLELAVLVSGSTAEDSQSLLDIHHYVPRQPNFRLIGMLDYILRRHDEYQEGRLKFHQLAEKWMDCLNDYYDYLMFQNKFSNSMIQMYETEILDIFKSFLGKYDMYVSANCAYVVARTLCNVAQASSVFETWEVKNNEKICSVRDTLMANYRTEYDVASDVVLCLQNRMEIKIGLIHLIFLVINFRLYNHDAGKKMYAGIVICHGYSAASSIADTVNKLLGARVIEGMDMPLDISENGIVEEVKRYIKHNSACRNMILMVDMGSLENIGQQLWEIPNINIGAINNVSTKMALGVGMRIRQGEDLDCILQAAAEEGVSTYTVYANSCKPKAIVFAAEAEDDAIGRVVRLFKNSFPKPVDIRVISHQFGRFQENLDQDEIFSRYDVLFVVGLTKVALKEHVFIPLEDIVAFSDISQVSSMFLQFFTEDEVRQLNSNIIKNFSLENIMNHLTILNADRLVSYMQDALGKLQQKTGIWLNGHLMTGMYLHICCLVERLVTKRSRTQEKAEGNLTEEEKQFIGCFQDSFSKIVAHYGITIPIHEILYLYRYGFKKEQR